MSKNGVTTGSLLLLTLSLAHQCYASSGGNDQTILSVPSSSSAANALIVSAEAAMSEVMVKLNHMQLLSTKAASGTYSSSQLSLLDAKFQLNKQEIDKIFMRSTLDNVLILNGGTLSSEETYSLQPFTAKDLGISSNESIDTLEGAKHALTDVASAFVKLNTLLEDNESTLVSPQDPSSTVVLTISNLSPITLKSELQWLKNCISDLLTQMNDLAMQAALGDYTPDELLSMNERFNNLIAEIDRRTHEDSFRQILLFTNNKLEINERKTIKLPYMSTERLGIQNLDISSAQGAKEAVQRINAAMVNVSRWLMDGKLNDGNVS